MKSAPLMVITVSIAPIVGYRSISLGEDAKHPECTVTVTIKVNSAAGTLCLTSLCIVLLCVYLPGARFLILLLGPIVGRRSNTPARPAHPSHFPTLRAGKFGGQVWGRHKKIGPRLHFLQVLCKINIACLYNIYSYSSTLQARAPNGSKTSLLTKILSSVTVMRF